MLKNKRLFSILFPVGILIIFSLTILSSINSAYLQQQSIALFVGVVLFIIFYNLDYHIYNFFPWIWYALSCILLISTYIFGTISRGSLRWIDLGFIRFQPSEFVKPLLIIFFSVIIAKGINSAKSYIKLLLFSLLPLILVFLQPDLGSTLIMIIVMASQLLSSKIPKKYITYTIAIILILSPILWANLRDYQIQRIESFMTPTNDPLGSGYNAIQSVISVGSGRFMGRGLGQGTQSQLKFLPERQTDFIFAAISEEFGFLGAAAVTLAYIWLLRSILVLARETQDETSRLLCIGTFSLIFIQAFVNIGMNIGIIPVTGITLPLVSLGGSSFISTAFLLGIISNTSQKYIPNRPEIEIK